MGREPDEVSFVDKRSGARGGDADEATDDPSVAAERAEEQGKGAESVAEALARAETYYKNWQRSAADFINYKRRVEQERGETARLYNAALVINLLPVFDDLERAVNTVDAHLAGLNWVQGVVAIQRKFAQLMEAMSVREVPAADEMFDPARHEAVGKQPGAEGKVLHVVQKGYMVGERVIRPAMVIVGGGGE